jgi:hypothetical protein
MKILSVAATAMAVAIDQAKFNAVATQSKIRMKATMYHP